MSEQIIKLAQINDPIIDNLANTDDQLNQLNQEVAEIVGDYQQANFQNQSEISFFNFNNHFFLLTLLGLIMLAISLAFLRKELKYGSAHKNRVESKSSKEVVLPVVVHNIEKPVEVNKEKKTAVISGRKIKVVKIK